MMLIVGAGVAGLSCALAAVQAGAEVELVTPGVLRGGAEAALTMLAGGNTAMAQGGIAAAVGAGDSPEAHAADTIAAGVGLVDPRAAHVLTADGAAAVRGLLAAGFPADRDAAGQVALGLEAAHRVPRIVHAGEDRTGAALHAFLVEQVLALVAQGRLRLTERTSLDSLLTDAGAISGAVLRDASGSLITVRTPAVVLATGGYAGLYPRTSNHAGARGEGIVIAARVGAVVADLEFVQFHPTVLAGTGFLISEAVRGAGAVLRDDRGVRFMQAAHADAELAPRDVVARALHRVLREKAGARVWLDATGIERDGGAGTLARRFPRITAATAAQGYDWAKEPVPVAPAAHYAMGGIATDLEARTTVPGLFAAGETAASGVHGANRLASNSLLEGLVFGARAGRAAVAHLAAPTAWMAEGSELAAFAGGATVFERPHSQTIAATSEPAPALAEASGIVAAAMTEGLGIERDAEGLRAVMRSCAALPGPAAELAGMIAQAAAARTESRGAHQRADHPRTDPAQAVRRAWVSRSTAPTCGTDGVAVAAPAPHDRSLAAC